MKKSLLSVPSLVSLKTLLKKLRFSFPTYLISKELKTFYTFERILFCWYFLALLVVSSRAFR